MVEQATYMTGGVYQRAAGVCVLRTVRCVAVLAALSAVAVRADECQDLCGLDCNAVQDCEVTNTQCKCEPNVVRFAVGVALLIALASCVTYCLRRMCCSGRQQQQHQQQQQQFMAPPPSSSQQVYQQHQQPQFYAPQQPQQQPQQYYAPQQYADAIPMEPNAPGYYETDEGR